MLTGADANTDPADIQATLLELTAVSITRAVTELKLGESTLVICGGGAHNKFLLQRLAAIHPGNVTTSADAGVEPDWVEAAAFAWLARARVHGETGNVPTVTGARQPAVLGGLYFRDPL